MIAYAFTRPGATCPFTGRIWRSDGWLADARATAFENLPVWIAPELWTVELEGRISTPAAQLLGERGRLVRRTGDWDDRAARDFVAACTRRTLEFAAQGCGDALPHLAADARTCGPADANLAGWLAARGAYVVDGLDGHHAERDRQQRWLSDRLRLGRRQAAHLDDGRPRAGPDRP